MVLEYTIDYFNAVGCGYYGCIISGKNIEDSVICGSRNVIDVKVEEDGFEIGSLRNFSCGGAYCGCLVIA